MTEEYATAVVTGAGSGLGRAIALQLADEGRDVACVDVAADAAEATADQVRARGRRSVAHPLDVRSRPDVEQAVRSVRDEWGRVDILVACAGVMRNALVVDVTEEDWDLVTDVHVKGTLFCCQAVLPVMAEQGYGRIVTTVSGLARAGVAGTAAYAAAKGAIISMTRVIAREAEPYGITVNAFGPGPTDTPMLKDVPDDRKDETVNHSGQFQFGRLPTAEQGAELAVWFTRAATAHITGRIFAQS